jgi:hypothetical protein
MCIGEPRLRLAVGNCPRAPLERTFDDGALHVFALKGRIQILDTLFDVGAAHLDIRLQVAITFRKRGNLFLATRKRCFADLQCLGQSVVTLCQCGSCLFVIFDLSFARLVRGFYLGQPLFRIVAGDHRLDRFAIEGTNFFCSGDKILSRFGQHSLGGFSREFEIFAQSFHFGLKDRRFSLDLVEFGEQRFIGSASFCQHS